MAHWDPAARRDSIGYSRVLLENAADPVLKNKRGSTPFDLAVPNTGRSGSGSVAAKEQQQEIINVLFLRGARPTGTATKP